VFCAGTVKATGQQLTASADFVNESIGNGAAPGGREGRHDGSSQESLDLV
jgi:hypothetical protein